MKRKIPDIINCKPSDNFTQIRNSVLRDKKISLKAKGLLALLLSNKKGWYSYAETIKNFSTDGDASIRTALKELENNSYLLRMRYREKGNKRIKGGFWAYTDIPGEFSLESTLSLLEENDLELLPHNTEKSKCGVAPRRKVKTNNTNIKNTNCSSGSFSKKKTASENKFSKRIKEQIKEVINIPELKELTSPLFIKEMSNYSPSNDEITYFIDNFGSEFLDYYKEYLIYSILEEKLIISGKKEMIVPRLALLNKNAARREHLYYATENSEEINFSLKSICRRDTEVIDKETKKKFLKDKASFTDFLKENEVDDVDLQENETQPEYAFLKHMRKLDNRNFDYLKDEDIDKYIEDLL